MTSQICYFFLGFFFFFTPPPGVETGADTPDPSFAIGSACSEAAVSVARLAGWRFCIFCMSVRFNASKRFRKTDEWVLNLRHYPARLALAFGADGWR